MTSEEKLYLYLYLLPVDIVIENASDAGEDKPNYSLAEDYMTMDDPNHFPDFKPPICIYLFIYLYVSVA